MAAARYLNPNNDSIRGGNLALMMSINAARGLQEVLRTNLGPKGTLKMLVSGAGDVKLTKDGNTLLHEMQIQHPTASLIARAATAQDDITGDGTTSTILIIGELLRQAERYLSENIHPRILADGFDAAREAALEFIEKIKIAANVEDRELLASVARTTLATKVHHDLCEHLTNIVVDAVQCISAPGKPIDLFMVEIMHMQHRSDLDTRLVRGLVLDHGGRHPDMPKSAENCAILILNVSFEYEKSEVNSAFHYKNAAQRDALVKAERKYTDDVVEKLIKFKREHIDPKGQTLIAITQKGIDAPSLDMMAREGIVGIRRAKRRNMERLMRACGGFCVNTIDDLSPECIGWAGKFHEHVLGEEKYTFIEDVKNPTSCTILVRGPDPHSIAQVKEALRDGLRSVKNVIEDKFVLPGAGAFEIALHRHLHDKKKDVKGRARLGVEAFADAVLVIPKTLAINAGFDAQDSTIKLIEAHEQGNMVGLDIETGETVEPTALGIYDQYRVKLQQLQSIGVIASQLLLVDEIIRAQRAKAPKSIPR